MENLGVATRYLRASATYMEHVTQCWGRAHSAIDGHTMDWDTDGLLGAAANLPRTYNNALREVLDRLNDGIKVLGHVAESLDRVADDYDKVDAGGAVHFKYIDEQMGH